MPYSLLKALLPLLEHYETTETSDQVADFTVWLNTQVFAPQEGEEFSDHDQLLIASKILHLNKAIKKETKIILAQSTLSSIDEYSFLLHLDYQDSFRKMELVDLHNLEAPTGIEIIKRLIKKGLINDFPDPEDGRAKRIRITDEGRQVIQMLRPQVEGIFKSFVHPLTLDEQIQLSGLLSKLMA